MEKNFTELQVGHLYVCSNGDYFLINRKKTTEEAYYTNKVYVSCVRGHEYAFTSDGVGHRFDLVTHLGKLLPASEVSIEEGVVAFLRGAKAFDRWINSN